MLHDLHIRMKKQFAPFERLKENGTQLPQNQREHYISIAEKRLKEYSWPSIPASLYMEFFENGNRSNFQKIYFEKRHVLLELVVAECMERKGRFLRHICDGIWNLCEESSWVIPAHNNHYRFDETTSILPNCTHPYSFVDLFAAETAAVLALGVYLLKEQLEKITPIIENRVKKEIQERIFRPYLECDGFEWMGLKECDPAKLNNWNPWINSNCLTCVLLLENDTEQKSKLLDKITRSLDAFLAGYGADGGCNEGPHYWTAAGAALFECVEMLAQVDDAVQQIFSKELIANMGRYIQRMHIAEDYYVNFADGGTKAHMPGELIYRYGMRIQDEALQGFGIRLFENSPDKGLLPVGFHPYRFFCAVSNYEQMQLHPKRDEKVDFSVWLENLEILVSRQYREENKGFYLAAKGGHNAESHNHNDVGNFVVYYNGKPALIDIGVETYTAKTFSPQRYEIWTMQSAWHNLPTIGGKMQQAGSEFCAKEVVCKQSAARDVLQMRLDEAYPADAGIQFWQRSLELDREKKLICVQDVFSLIPESPAPEWNIVTCCKPVVQADGNILLFMEGTNLELCLPEGFRAQAETVLIKDELLKQDWNNEIYRIRVKGDNQPHRREMKLLIRECDGNA